MPLACFQCADILFAAKHAKGMSLRYGAIVLRDLIPLFSKKLFYYQGFFCRERASGFYPWCNVVRPRKRVAEGLCGWRHGNLFPMTQSAQSHRQMRSIPRCFKAVFYVFVFGPFTIRQQCRLYLHDFFTEPKK